MPKPPKSWQAPATRIPKPNNQGDGRIGEYPSHLRGIATNRYGGNNLQHEEGLRGGTYGPASPVRFYTDDKRKKYERELRQRGDLS